MPARSAPSRSKPASAFRLPAAPGSIETGSTLKTLLDRGAIDCLAHNLGLVHHGFDTAAFRRDAREGLEPLAILARGLHLAKVLRRHLPERYEEAIKPWKAEVASQMRARGCGAMQVLLSGSGNNLAKEDNLMFTVAAVEISEMAGKS